MIPRKRCTCLVLLATALIAGCSSPVSKKGTLPAELVGDWQVSRVATNDWTPYSPQESQKFVGQSVAFNNDGSESGLFGVRVTCVPEVVSKTVMALGQCEEFSDIKKGSFSPKALGLNKDSSVTVIETACTGMIFGKIVVLEKGKIVIFGDGLALEMTRSKEVPEK